MLGGYTQLQMPSGKDIGPKTYCLLHTHGISIKKRVTYNKAAHGQAFNTKSCMCQRMFILNPDCA